MAAGGERGGSIREKITTHRDSVLERWRARSSSLQPPQLVACLPELIAGTGHAHVTAATVTAVTADAAVGGQRRQAVLGVPSVLQDGWICNTAELIR
jgi:hypothetical protein